MPLFTEKARQWNPCRPENSVAGLEILAAVIRIKRKLSDSRRQIWMQRVDLVWGRMSLDAIERCFSQSNQAEHPTRMPNPDWLSAFPRSSTRKAISFFALKIGSNTGISHWNSFRWLSRKTSHLTGNGAGLRVFAPPSLSDAERTSSPGLHDEWKDRHTFEELQFAVRCRGATEYPAFKGWPRAKSKLLGTS